MGLETTERGEASEGVVRDAVNVGIVFESGPSNCVFPLVGSTKGAECFALGSGGYQFDHLERILIERPSCQDQRDGFPQLLVVDHTMQTRTHTGHSLKLLDADPSFIHEVREDVRDQGIIQRKKVLA
jgi:hypothetical protein